MSSTVPQVPLNLKAQGRSASGRNGGARKATSSNKVVVHFCLIKLSFDLVAFKQIVCMAKRSSPQLFACGSVFYLLDWFARSQLRL